MRMRTTHGAENSLNRKCKLQLAAIAHVQHAHTTSSHEQNEEWIKWRKKKIISANTTKKKAIERSKKKIVRSLHIMILPMVVLPLKITIRE